MTLYPATLRTLVLLVLGLGVAAPLAAQLDATERSVSEYIDAHVEEGIDLLARQAEIGSGTQDHEGIRRVADLLAPELARSGSDAEWIPQDARRSGRPPRRGADRARRVAVSC